MSAKPDVPLVGRTKTGAEVGEPEWEVGWDVRAGAGGLQEEGFL